MNRYILLLIVMMAMAACNSQSASNAAASDSLANAPVKTDTAHLAPVPTHTNAVPHDNDMQDDTVFEDRSKPTAWANAGIDHPVAFKQFLKRLQGWVVHDEKDSVAAVIAFPLQHPPVQNKAAFIAHYDTLINEKVKTALINQNMRQIFRRDQGAMIGDGELWFTETTKGFVITSINN